MKNYKHLIIIILLAFAIPLFFWIGVKHGNSINSMLVSHGTELIRLSKDIQGVQIHIAELLVENDKLKSRISKIQIHQETIRIHQAK